VVLVEVVSLGMMVKLKSPPMKVWMSLRRESKKVSVSTWASVLPGPQYI
jgi:hypothetical protein